MTQPVYDGGGLQDRPESPVLALKPAWWILAKAQCEIAPECVRIAGFGGFGRLGPVEASGWAASDWRK
jgi:hypothetical protein